ncbi:MAG: hypothetical protein CR982_05170 [Candidatus Cloacimonadota bacterium]|nr:MAG: hypothetical protein CR982_05170 [Candidatus Cloacimonadota bacterium]
MREAWQNKKLSKEYYFIYIDATYLPIRRNREVDKEAFHVIMGVTKDLKREILGIYNYPSESSLGYKEIFIDLRRRGFRKSLLCIADGFKRIKKALQEEFPGIPLQTCLFYKLKNLKSRIRSNKWQEFLSDFHSVFKKEETIIIQKKMSYWN